MTRRSISTVLALLMLCAAAATGQQPAAPSGHWVGAIEAGQKLDVEVDIGRDRERWRGTISIPAQGTKGVPLADLVVKEPAVTFGIANVPGDPRFAGQLSPDGKTLTGTFSQGGGSVPMSLEWKGE